MSRDPGRRQLILEALKARIERIARSRDFRTDAGHLVFLHEEVELGQDDPETAVAIVAGEDEPSWHGEHTFLTLPVEFWAVVKISQREPWKAAEQVLADIKEAIELPDRTLGRLLKPNLERGVTRTVPRVPGSQYVVIGITYTCRFTEVWGAPQN
jgi:hypothetical protein